MSTNGHNQGSLMTCLMLEAEQSALRPDGFETRTGKESKMGRIHMPPDGLHREKYEITPYCQPYKDDPLFIEVTEDGEFLCLPQGCFSANLPEGFVEAGQVLGPFNPIKNDQDVLMVYFDNESFKTYATKIEIRSLCLDGPIKDEVQGDL